MNYGRIDLADNGQMDMPGFLIALQAVGYDDFINVIEPARDGVSAFDLARKTAVELRRLLAARP